MIARPGVSAEAEEYRDQSWQREGSRQVETAFDAERFIERVGFAACLTDSRRPGPSLYVAVCGRRDAIMPRNVQKDPEASHTWLLKDEVVRRGRVYYGKLTGARTLFVAPRMVPFFHAVWGMRRAQEPTRLSRPAQAILRVLRREWEIATSDLRDDSGVKDRKAFSRGAGRATGRDARRPQRGVLPAEVHLHLESRGRTVSERAAAPHWPCQGASRDRPLLSIRGRNDGARRAGTCNRVVTSRRWAWQSCAGGRGARHDACARRVPVDARSDGRAMPGPDESGTPAEPQMDSAG